jgi:hypothetical protein
MTLPASTPAPAERASLDQILRVSVALVGLIEGINGLSGLPMLFGDVAKVPGFTPAGLTIIAWIVLHPLLGFTAFALALSRRLRIGIMALALMALMEWASDVPSIITHGLKLSRGTHSSWP